ncbi:MAG: TlpA family protein disulfide reductase [Proteobacteria bacterium]|nr:TlpA family protein disulfide reductase [Pseudomonadota bacterium]
MSFWKQKDNLVIAGLVVLFFVGLTYWYEPCCVRAALHHPAGSSLATPFLDENQTQHTLAEFQGGPLIVNFWATWCPVCVKKMGTLNNFAQKFQEQGGTIISLSEDSGGLSTVKAYYARHGYQNLPIYLDTSGQLMSAFGASGLPTSIFIDASGKELGRIAGGIDWESEPVRKMVEQYFNIHLK